MVGRRHGRVHTQSLRNPIPKPNPDPERAKMGENRGFVAFALKENIVTRKRYTGCVLHFPAGQVRHRKSRISAALIGQGTAVPRSVHTPYGAPALSYSGRFFTTLYGVWFIVVLCDVQNAGRYVQHPDNVNPAKN